ncbi:4Fe-4S dicluster domain-containing protein [candidate division KSB1 bacterium]|nr:4Fe-4S dicluster domain-containing protein [candidate division KSB1 bacterium]
MSEKSQSTNPPAEIVPIYILGKRYDVPASLTIQKAMEYAGYQLIRGCGCRGGICGACGTIYRFPNDSRLHFGLACQTVVEPNMYLTQIPFFPGNKAVYDIEAIEPTGVEIVRQYPEVVKCMGCNACTESCPMDIKVMEYMSAAINGDVKRTAELSFDCVMCGLCSSRCPAEEVQYNIAILARRLNAKYLTPKAKHLEDRVKQIDEGRYEVMLRDVMKADPAELRRLYIETRQMEPAMADEMWEPEDKRFL